MKYLLDTHTFLWTIMDTSKLSSPVRDIICHGNTDIFVSSISFWEIAIKVQLGKLEFNNFHILHLPNIADQYEFTIHTPSPYDYITYSELEPVEGHQDPFDRLLIHSAIRNNMTMLSCDNWFKKYQTQGLHLLW